MYRVRMDTCKHQAPSPRTTCLVFMYSTGDTPSIRVWHGTGVGGLKFQLPCYILFIFHLVYIGAMRGIPYFSIWVSLWMCYVNGYRCAWYNSFPHPSQFFIYRYICTWAGLLVGFRWVWTGCKYVFLIIRVSKFADCSNTCFLSDIIKYRTRSARGWSFCLRGNWDVCPYLPNVYMTGSVVSVHVDSGMEPMVECEITACFAATSWMAYGQYESSTFAVWRATRTSFINVRLTISDIPFCYGG